jgi:hypothetical protein
LKPFIAQQRNTIGGNVPIGLRGNNAEPGVQVSHRKLSLERSRSVEEDRVAFAQTRKVRLNRGLRDAGRGAIFPPYARDRELQDVLYAHQPYDGLHRRCRVDQHQRAACVLLGKPSPQLDRLFTAKNVRRMTRVDANKQIARKFRYRVHRRPSAESAALNQQTVAAPR